jgi:hypothetical protein
VNYPGYFKVFASTTCGITLNERLTAVRRKDGRLEVDLYNEYAHVTRQRIVDQVVVEHGTLPSDELYFSLVPGQRISVSRPAGAARPARAAGAAQSGRPLSVVPHR